MIKKLFIIFFSMFFISNTAFAFDEKHFSSVFKSDNQKTWEFYMRDVEYKIKKNWKPPQLSKSAKIVVYMLIGRNGELMDLKIKEKSYNKELDNSAREAVILAAPFEPLPKEYKGDTVPIEFSFDYNVVNKK